MALLKGFDNFRKLLPIHPDLPLPVVAGCFLAAGVVVALFIAYAVSLDDPKAVAVVVAALGSEESQKQTTRLASCSCRTSHASS